MSFDDIYKFLEKYTEYQQSLKTVKKGGFQDRTATTVYGEYCVPKEFMAEFINGLEPLLQALARYELTLRDDLSIEHPVIEFEVEG